MSRSPHTAATALTERFRRYWQFFARRSAIGRPPSAHSSRGVAGRGLAGWAVPRRLRMDFRLPVARTKNATALARFRRQRLQRSIPDSHICVAVTEDCFTRLDGVIFCKRTNHLRRRTKTSVSAYSGTANGRVACRIKEAIPRIPMRIQTPSSRATFSIRCSPVDVCLAAVSPLLALYLRDAYILSHDGVVTVAIYCIVSLAFSLIAFSAFGLRDGMPRYFSVRDAT